jgi:hypothetical protein
MNDPMNDRFMRFLTVLRQAFLMVCAWIESETGTQGKGGSGLRATTEIKEAPLQFRTLTEGEIDKIAERVTNKVLTKLNTD